MSTPTETDGAVFPGRIMLANTCTWTYRGDECGYHGPAVADEYDQPTSDITKDKCSKCLSGCKFRNNVGNGKGTSTRPTLTVSNLYGMVTGMAEDLQSLVGGTVLRRKVYARFLDAVNFVNGNSDADPEQEVISRWRIEQCSELSAVSASFVLSTPTETDGAVFPGRIMLANTCTWTYRGDECGYHGPAVADEYDQPTSDITKDKCSKCLSGCKFRNNVGNFGGFLSINKLSQ
ncbi:phage minor tail protein L [Escherichia coli]|uniref:phage minor tail protein L n=1 Tax=Escherichia coli TaxID=562 RepID=UPI00201EC78B|nr:phage minor tail protein L [Escherichia coli]